MKQSTANYVLATAFYNESLSNLEKIWKAKFGVSLNYKNDFFRILKQFWYKSSLLSDY